MHSNWIEIVAYYIFERYRDEIPRHILLENNSRSGLFSVTCGSASDSMGRTTRPTLVTGTFECNYGYFILLT